LRKRRIYLVSIVSPRYNADGTDVFVERKVSEVKRTEDAVVHRWIPTHVAVAMYYCQLQRVWRHLDIVKTTTVSTAQHSAER